MTHPTPKPNQMFLLKVIWLAMFASVGSLTLISYLQYGPLSLDVSFDFEQPLVGEFLFLSVMALAMSVFVPRRLQKKAAEDLRKNPEIIETVKGRYFVSMVVRFALIESICMYGLVLSFKAEENMTLLFVVTAGLAFMASFPTEEKCKTALGMSSQQSFEKN